MTHFTNPAVAQFFENVQHLHPLDQFLVLAAFTVLTVAFTKFWIAFGTRFVALVQWRREQIRLLREQLDTMQKEQSQ